MSDHATTLSTPPSEKSRLLRAYLLEAKFEWLKQFRMPAYFLPSIGFPVMFYLLFGSSFGGSQAVGSVTMSTFLLATYGAFGAIGVCLFGFGVGVAVERGQGWLLLKRASPMPPGAFFTAKIIASLGFVALVVLTLFITGYAVGGVRLATGTWMELAAIIIVGSLPFCAFGLLLGHLAGPNSAPAVVNLIYLPMAFASGLWIPIQMLPSFFQELAPWLPAYHYSQLALKVIGADQGRSAMGHVCFLLGFTILCLVLATWAWNRGDKALYG